LRQQPLQTEPARDSQAVAGRYPAAMYAPYFGLSHEPFSLAPDPRFLYLSERHREALAHLLYGVGGGGGFVLLTGEIGAGKTTVARCFLEQLPAHCVVAYIFNPCLSVIELLQTVCSEFGLPELPPGATVKAHVDVLNRFLLEAHAQGRHALLVIDEAQALDAAVLEQLRLLTNLETAERKLLQIVLIGQPELRSMLAQPGLEQLAQRVIARYHLKSLSAAETRQYVLHRLGVAGPNVPVPFDNRALARLHSLTGGVPRRINLLADRALLGAYSQRQRHVDTRMVDKAAAEVFDRPVATAWPRQALLVALVGLVLAGVALTLGTWPWGRPTAAAKAASAAAAAVTAAAPALASASSSASSLATTVATSVASSLASGAAAASQAAAAATALLPASDSPAALLAAASADEAKAWRELALHWNVAIGEGDPCVVAAQAQLACFRSTSGGFQLARQLGRPALLMLRGNSGQRVFALLVALDDSRATLQVGRQRFDLTPQALAGAWRGEIATFWRTPPGWRAGRDGDLPAETRAWVEQQLGPPPSGTASRPWRDRVLAYQLLQGLPPDGRAGPLTLMHINRTAGVDEPRLAAAAGR